MANTTSWAPGNLNSGSFAWQPAFGTEINSLATTDSVLSSIAFDNSGTVANGGTGAADSDQWMDLSAICTIASSTIAAGACFSFWLAYLQGDGSTYGDGRSTTTPAAYTPLQGAIKGIPFAAGSSITTLVGSSGLIPLLPRKFKLIVQNNSGFALAASGNSIKISTYREQLNS